MRCSVKLLFAISLLCSSVYAEEYGFFQPQTFQSERFEKIKKATATIIKNENLFLKNVPAFNEVYKFCGNEKFVEEKLWSNCSGILISKNTVLTAGHCISDQKICADKSIAFDYDSNADIPRIQNNKDLIYKCNKVIYWSHPIPQKQIVDFALIQLDRDVTDREPIQLSEKKLTQIEDIYSSGHPLGLPLKISAGFINSQNAFKNKTEKKSFYNANLPTHPGLSGGGVYNSDLDLVGILVRGDNNFETEDGRCQRSIPCDKDSCPTAEVQKLQLNLIHHLIQKRN